jgi:hypothetical protein
MIAGCYHRSQTTGQDGRLGSSIYARSPQAFICRTDVAKSGARTDGIVDLFLRQLAQTASCSHDQRAPLSSAVKRAGYLVDGKVTAIAGLANDKDQLQMWHGRIEISPAGSIRRHPAGSFRSEGASSRRTVCRLLHSMASVALAWPRSTNRPTGASPTAATAGA